MSHYESHLEKAREFYRDGNYAGARAAAQKAIECALNEEDDEARHLLALSDHKLEYTDEAFRIWESLSRRHPTPEMCESYALMRAEKGLCDDECREFAARAIASDPDSPNAYLALFFCDVADDRRQEAVVNLRRAVHRGAEISAQKAFELVRSWCQEACNAQNRQAALALSSEIVDTFSSLEFLLLHARLAEVCQQPRIAVKYYQQALHVMPTGKMRTEVLETVAAIAI